MKNKLARFAEMEVLPNVFQPRHTEIFRTDYTLKGKWGQEVFHNNHPIVLEICLLYTSDAADEIYTV